ncbi:MAG: polysaccharide deacetylase family protein [bacterium]|nr:MAG: polysaccharide deacetylase family protein [bacterium]
MMKGHATTCINHPGKQARRKCFHCLLPICPACQRRALGHIFCSAGCQHRYWLSDMVLHLKRLYLRISLRFRRVERSFQRVAGGGLLRIISLSLLVLILAQTLVLNGIVRDLHGKPGGAPDIVFRTPDLEIFAEGGWVILTGSAPGFSTAVLLTDGRERDVCAITEGHFTFNLRPEDDDHTVQVQVFGDRLPVLYTRSILLPDQGEVLGAVRPQDAAIEPSGAPIPPAVELRDEKDAGQGTAGTSPLPSPHEDFSRGSPDLRSVAITFDGGSYSNAAGRILDVLGERGLKATFFLTGEFIRSYPEVTRRIASEGHEVGNHMYSHPRLTTFARNLRHEVLPGVNRDFVVRELKRNEEVFEELTGRKMVPFWRAPYGEQNEQIRRWALEAGYRHVSWTYDPKTKKSLDSLDWVSDSDSALYLTSDQIVSKILSFDRETDRGLAGGIVLLHLGSERKVDPFYPKLGDLIDQLEERGYRLGLVSNMLEVREGG